MKKKLVTFILSICIVCSSASCGSSSKSVEPQQEESVSAETDEATDSTETETQDPNSESVSVPENEQSAETTIEDLEQYLLDHEVITGERTDKTASLIGAVSGFGYGNEDVEVYEFDVNSDAYKNLLETNSINLEYLGTTITPAAINGKYVLIFSNNSDPDSNIVDVFNSYGK